MNLLVLYEIGKGCLFFFQGQENCRRHHINDLSALFQWQQSLLRKILPHVIDEFVRWVLKVAQYGFLFGDTS